MCATRVTILRRKEGAALNAGFVTLAAYGDTTYAAHPPGHDGNALP